jgi:hypothetical protein
VLGFALGGVAGLQAAPKSVPRLQVIPLPQDQISFQRDGVELTRYFHSTNQFRPFLFPIQGPSGRSLTRLGHPHDPVSHSHHNSFWVAHHDVNGLSAWEDRGAVRIVHRRVERLEDGDAAASVLVVNHWVADTGEVLLEERRRMTVETLPKGEWQLLLDLRLEPLRGAVTLGKTPFGLVGIRMAKTMGVNDGGGTIRSSAGGVNEPGVLWKPARWVDYAGPITSRAIEGLTLMDHPSNPNHPSVFHVRNDGWMGASLTFDGPRVLQPGEAVVLRYGVYVHAGEPSMNALQRRWLSFAEQTVPAFPAGRK